MNKVSVVIPVYNSAPHLRECLDSVLSQTLREIEVICVDDGSSDGSLEILKKIAADDQRVRVIEQSNLGASAARNRALDEVTGEFVAFMDADDLYPDERVLADLHSAVTREGADLACGGLAILLPDGRVRGAELEEESWMTSPSVGVSQVKDYPYDQGFTKFLYSARLVKRGLRFPAYRRYEDPVFLVRALSSSERVVSVGRCVYHYRVDWRVKGGAKKKYSIEIYRDYVRALSEIVEIASSAKLDAVLQTVLTHCRGDEFSGMLGMRPYEDGELFAALCRLESLGADLPLLKRINKEARVYRMIKQLIGEFLRYVIVGGLAFVADFSALVAAQELVLKQYTWGVYAATVVGFVVGLVVNYALSLSFVFTQEKDRGKGRSFGAFVAFGIIGLIGLGWMELGMWIGVELLTLNYKIVKIFITGVVLMWNYLGRKILIFNGKESSK